MAGREGQGLQIAVIIFAMLTIILAITTFIFYSQAQTAQKARDEAVTAEGTVQTENDKLRYRVRAYQLALGLKGTTQADVDAAKQTAGGDDEEVKAVEEAFKADMATYAAEAGAAGAVNYRTLPQFLLTSLSKKNVSVADANQQTRDTQTQKDEEVKAQVNRVTAAELAAGTARDELAKEKTAYQTDRDRIQAEKDKLAAQIGDKDKKAKAEYDKLAKDRDAVFAQATQQQQTIENQKLRVKELESTQVDLFENPDGKITWVNQKQRLVWVNLGRADGLMRQTNFSVYEHNENGVANAEPKARLEVVRIVGEHLAEASILEDTAANPILPGDIVHTPSWSPGQRIHFALAGFMDINNDRVSDFDLVKNIILLNGGIIDAEIQDDGTRVGKLSVNTRYLVLGNAPDEKSTKKMVDEYTLIRRQAGEMATDTIDVQRLLEMMGWKAEERTVELAGSAGRGEFRTRTPGKKAAPAATPPPAGAAPAEAAPAPAGGVDPFGPAAADPFGEPAAKPMPMPAAPAEADPFGTP